VTAARQALTAWLDHLAHEKRASPRTVRAYGDNVLTYLNFLERHRGEALSVAGLGEVTAAELRAYLAFRRDPGEGEDGLSPRSLSQSLSSIRAFHRYLAHRLDTPNAAIGLVRGPRIKVGAPRPVSEDQAHGLIAELSLDPDRDDWEVARDEAVLTLLWGCGLRISEGLSLSRRDAPLADSLRITGKGGKTRIVPVLDIVRQRIDAYLAALPFALGPDDALFRARRGGPLSPRHVQATMQTLRGRLGLSDRATPHALRHSFATHLWAPAPTCDRSRTCWATPRCRRPSATTQVDAAGLLAAYGKAHPRA
jgi:integrase/recombinase XerC